jgi:hypothetical protein
MGIKNNSKKTIDNNFKDIVKILSKSKISYWMCHGTLLGIIRDKKLIPWDHDIDVAIWNSIGIRTKIKKIMLKNNFFLNKKYYPGDGFLSFSRPGGREVDFNFYEKKIFNNETFGVIRFLEPRNNLCKLVEACAAGKKFNGKYKNLIRIFSFIDFIFIFLKKTMIEKKYFFVSKGYIHPISLLSKFKKIKSMNSSVWVPLHSKKCIKFIYGKNWAKPDKQYDHRAKPSWTNV